MKSRKAELIARAVTSLNIIDACSCVRLLCTSVGGRTVPRRPFFEARKEWVKGIQNDDNENDDDEINDSK